MRKKEPFFLIKAASDQFAAEGGKNNWQIKDDPDYYIADKGSCLSVKLRKRSAYPGTYYKQTIDAMELGYGDDLQRDGNEFLRVVITHGKIVIQRDAFCVLPLFYVYVDSVFVCSNNYEALLQTLPTCYISEAGIVESLFQRGYWQQSCVEGVTVLQECETLTFSAAGVELRKPSDRSWVISKETPPTDPRDFLDLFSSHLDHFIQTRFYNQRIAFEVSGGLDSCTLPQYMAQKYDYPAHLATMGLIGNEGVTQGEKLTHLIDVTGFNKQVHRVNFESSNVFPLSHMISTGEYRPFYLDETHTSHILQMAQSLHSAGVQVVATGIGGDEVFENIVRPSDLVVHGTVGRRKREEDELPPFITAKFRRGYIDATPKAPPRARFPHAMSNIGAQLSRNNCYISYDIWPVSPFADPGLYAYCQGLPIHYRSNKNILRAYHQAHGFIDKIYNPTQNENYVQSFLHNCKSEKFRTALDVFGRNSLSAQLGYINEEKLRQAIENGLERADQEPTTAADLLYRAYLWLCLEVNLRYTPNKQYL